MLTADVPLASRGREGGGGGSPESEDLPVAVATDPLEEGGDVLRSAPGRTYGHDPGGEKQADQGRRERSYPEDTGASEDAGRRRFAAAKARAYVRPGARKLFALGVLAIVAALAVPAVAAAFTVQVRVEGAARTIFGATEPLVTPYVGTLPVDGGGSVDVKEPTALGTLESASLAGEFYYRIQAQSFGPYVSQIGRLPGEGASGWVYKVNGVSPPVGADAYVVKPGDEVLWYYATFSDTGGPSTLDLVRAGRCYRALSVNDAGERAQATGVVFRLDSRSVRSASGRICPVGHWHQLRATKEGAIRSQVLVRR
jgi:hypothetical protein